MHSHDRTRLRALVKTLIAPRRVAIVGSQGPTGFAGRLRRNIEAGRGCEYYFISKSGTPHGPVFDSFQSLPHAVDTAVISVPAEAVVKVVSDGIAAGTRCFIVHSAGFGESDARGRVLQNELVALCDDAGAIVLGPNCLGLYNQRAGIPLTPLLLPRHAVAGGVGLISQSGTVANTLLNTSRPVPFACIVTTGNEAGVTLEDILDVFVEDPAVTVIGLFVEQLRQPQLFVELALRARELGKPIVALKTGVTNRGASMTRSHTGALAGSGRVYAEVFRRVGVLSARDIDELAELLLLVSSEPRVLGARRAAILGNSGGLLALAADVSEGVGLELSTLSESTVASLRKVLQTDEEVEPGNPLDYPIGFRNTRLSRIDRFKACLEILDADENTDVVAVATELAEPVPDDAGWVYCAALLEALGTHRARSMKPVVAYSHASNGVHPRLLEIARTHGVPLLEGARPALNALAAAGRYGSGLATSSPGAIRPRTGPPWLPPAPTGNQRETRDGYQILAGLGVPFVEEITTGSAEEAAEVARSVGMPVVLKVKSPDIAHKAAVGGVATDVHDVAQVRTCFEAILRSVRRSAPSAAIEGVTVSRQVPPGAEVFIGLKKDPDFGPVLLVGSGGVLVDEIDDVKIAFPPLDDDEAASIVSGIRALRRITDRVEDAGLSGSRRKLHEALVNLSRRAVDLCEHIDELDINPIIVWGPEAGQLAAVDVNVVPVRNR